jgi:CarD family transcriptional regulator
VRYRVGTTVIHPHHGPAKITAKPKRLFDGKNVTFLELEVSSDEPRFNPGMRIFVVESKADEIGLRLAASTEDAQEVLDILSNMKNVRMPANWSRRFKNHTSMLATGDIFQVAAVVRNLYIRNSGASKLSAGERNMQLKAEHLLSAELAVTWDITPEEARGRLHEAMAKAVKSANVTTDA